MPKLIVLGTANAIPDENHENTHLAIIGEHRQILIDCVGNPVIRLTKAGIDLISLTDIILTHFHPDHVSGLANFLMDMWILGRNNELRIYGSDHTLSRVKKLMDLFDWDEWGVSFIENHGMADFFCSRCQKLIKTIPFDDIPVEKRQLIVDTKYRLMHD